MSKLIQLHNMGYVIGILTPSSIHIEVSKQQIFFTDFRLLQKAKNGLNILRGVARQHTTAQLSKVLNFKTQVSAQTLFSNDRHIMAQLAFNILKILKVSLGNPTIKHLLSFISDLVDFQQKEQSVYQKYDNLMLVDPSLYLPLCKRCIQDGANEFSNSFLNLYISILNSEESRGKVFD